MKNITANDVQNGSSLIKELLEKNDPLIREMIHWYCKGTLYKKEFVEKELQQAPKYRKQFYRHFKVNCQDSDIRSKFYMLMGEFFVGSEK